MKFIILFFFSLSVAAHEFNPKLPKLFWGHWCEIHWVAPVQYENGNPINQSDITYQIQFLRNSKWRNYAAEDYELAPLHVSEFQYPWSTCLKCSEVRIRSDVIARVETDPNKYSVWTYCNE